MGWLTSEVMVPSACTSELLPLSMRYVCLGMELESSHRLVLIPVPSSPGSSHFDMFQPLPSHTTLPTL